MNLDHAARRYAHVRTIELEVGTVEESIKQVGAHLAEVQEELDELRTKKKGLLADMRAAARDEGELPLLDLAEALGIDAPPPASGKGKRKPS